MFWWILFAAILILALYSCAKWLYLFLTRSETQSLLAELRVTQALLLDLKDLLLSGIVPPESLWQKLALAPGAVGQASALALFELKKQGQPLIPSLERFQDTLAVMSQGIGRAWAKAGQARMQALVFLFITPTLAFTLPLLLPEIASTQSQWIWYSLSAGAFALCLLGHAWILKEAQACILGPRSASSLLSILKIVGAERLLSSLQCGNSIDEAWSQTHTYFLAIGSPLALQWNPSAFRVDSQSSFHSLAEIIQVSLWEGSSLSERIDLWIKAEKSTWANALDSRVEKLPTVCLKPLFICIAPAILFQLGSALGLVILKSPGMLGT